MSCFPVSSFVIRSCTYTLPSAVLSFYLPFNALSGVVVSVINSAFVTAGESWGDKKSPFIKRVAAVVSLAVSFFFLSYFGTPLMGKCGIVPLTQRDLKILTVCAFCVGAVFPRKGKEESDRPIGETVHFLTRLDQLEQDPLVDQPISKKERGALLELLKAPLPAEEEMEPLIEENISTMRFSTILRVFYQLQSSAPASLEDLPKSIRDKVLKRVKTSWIFQQENTQGHAQEQFLSFLENPDNLTSMTLSQALSIFHTLEERPCSFVKKIPEESREHLLNHFHNYFLSPFPRSKEEAMNVQCDQSWECSEYLEKWGEESMDFMKEDTRVAFCEHAKNHGYTEFLIKSVGGS